MGRPADTYTGPGVVLRPGELFLKGKNRRLFEERLERNLRRALADRSDVTLRREHGRLFVLGACDETLLGLLADVPGLSSVSPAVFCERDIDRIEAAALELAKGAAGQGGETFRISARRPDKSFPLTSREIGVRVGAAVATATGLGVDLEQHDLEVGIEIGRGWVFLWTERRAAAGGLPVGTGGRAMLLLSGGIDSPVAGHLLQKRGLELAAVYFHAFPYTGDGARDKVVELARVLARRQERLALHVVQFARLQEALRDGAPSEYLVILYRRAMIRIAERLANAARIPALATGESLGQVASQTLANMAAIEDAAGLPLLRPLLAFDKAETIELARACGTYEISIQPHDDCCTLFVPRHPETRGSARRAARHEAQVEWEPLLEEAVEGVEVVEL